MITQYSHMWTVIYCANEMMNPFPGQIVSKPSLELRAGQSFLQVIRFPLTSYHSSSSL